MGKDQDFLDAARNGDIAYVEKVLNHRAKRNGPLASLRRGPGVNFQNSIGYSALHHACLNGHSDIVRLLLAHEASPNLPDARGSSPLHLAAWAGHQDIVKMLLMHPYRPANPNILTIENETPLHCAAQHGHIGALGALLLQNADPNVRNSRNETPLDLAAQYGRLQAVQMLIRSHPELLTPYYEDNMDPNKLKFSHTCLHLASRNGHKNVVDLLLAAGVSVNLRTASGTALHEAALCGKESVVRTLLRAGINLNCTDAEGRTALDILKEFPAHVTKGIISVIKSEWRNATGNEILLQKHHKHYEQQQKNSSQSKHHHSRSHHYLHFNSNNHLLNHSHTHSLQQQQQQQNYYGSNSGNSKMSIECSDADGVDYPSATSNSQNDIAGVSPSSSMSSFEPASISPRSRCSTGGDVANAEMGLGNTVPPKKPPRRNLSVSPTHNNVSQHNNHRDKQVKMRKKVQAAHEHSKSYTSSNDKSTSSQQQMDLEFDPSAAVPHKNVLAQKAPLAYDYMCVKSSGKDLGTNITSSSSSDILSQRYHYVDQYVEMLLGKDDDDEGPNADTSETIAQLPELAPLRHQVKLFTKCVNPIMKSYNPNRKLKRNRYKENFNGDQRLSSTSCDTNSDREQTQLTQTVPTSPTNYCQPPTPEHPPPSVNQAERLIHARMRPLSLEYKRRSQGATIEMVESTTSPPVADYYTTTSCCESLASPKEMYHHNQLSAFTQLGGSSDSLSSSISYSVDSVSTTDNVEEYVCDDDPFAGLVRGSAVLLHNEESHIGSGQLQRNSTSNVMKISSAHPHLETIDINEPVLSLESHLQNANNNSDRMQQLSVDESSSSWQERIKKYLERRNEGSTTQQNLQIDLLPLTTKTTSNSCCSLIVEGSSVLSPFNEEEAWEKISEIIESFGSGILNDDYCDNDSQNKAAKLLLDFDYGFDDQEMPAKRYEVVNRLRQAGLLHLERILFENGYDNYKFMNGVLDANEVELMNIRGTDATKLLNFVETLPLADFKLYVQPQNEGYAGENSNISVSKQGVLTLSEWLASIDLVEYTECFKKHLYNTIESVCGVWDVELQTVLEINKLGHRRRILQSLAYIRENDKRLAVRTGNIETPLCTTNTPNQTKRTTEKRNVTQGQGHVMRKNRPAPPPPTRSTHSKLTVSNKETNENQNETQLLQQKLEIRAPSELALELPKNVRTKWRHSAIALVYEQIKYEVYYLGSTIVRDLRGIDSTRKSIHKLRRNNFVEGTKKAKMSSIQKQQQQHKKELPKTYNSNLEYQKSLIVCLAISQKGVEFIEVARNAVSKNNKQLRSICVHEIQNINCACQDANDLNYFAYITKENDCHYCHVFNASNTDLATEIILTLGQAFEVAYQLALRDGSIKSSKAESEAEKNTSDCILLSASDGNQ